MTNLDSILKSRDITLPTTIHLVKAMVFPVVMCGWTGWIFLQSKGLSRVFSNTTVQKHHSSMFSFLYGPILTSTHDHWKTIALTRWTFVGKVMSLLFKILFRLDNSFSSKEEASFNFTVAVTICSDFGAQENKVCQCFHCFPINLP